MAALIFRSAFPKLRLQDKYFHGTSILSSFNEVERSNYPLKYDRPPNDGRKQSIREQIVGGYKLFKNETKLFVKEMKENLSKDYLYKYKPEITLWKFTKDPAVLDQWVLTCDSDYNEGYSTCRLDLSPNGTGIFSGNLSTRIPKDGKIKYAGFCNMRTLEKRISFKRAVKHDFYPYTHIVLRIRGDGRVYSINIHCKDYSDLTWNDCYHYPMYTTGGPYWQTVKIPFSKFVFSSKGTVQDSQFRFLPSKVSHIGITMADKVNGPFKLEMDYIGLELDEEHYEDFAYELYYCPDVKM